MLAVNGKGWIWLLPSCFFNEMIKFRSLLTWENLFMSSSCCVIGLWCSCNFWLLTSGAYTRWSCFEWDWEHTVGLLRFLFRCYFLQVCTSNKLRFIFVQLLKDLCAWLSLLLVVGPWCNGEVSSLPVHILQVVLWRNSNAGQSILRRGGQVTLLSLRATGPSLAENLLYLVTV